MSEQISKEQLVGRWTHVHEEDSGDEMVFRPADAPLPPSRGRKTFELKPDGTLVEQGPGPTDRKQRRSGHWTFDASGVMKFFQEGTHDPVRSMQVLSVDPDRLVVKK